MHEPDLSHYKRSTAIRGLRRAFSALAPDTEAPENAAALRDLLLLGGALFTLALLTYFCTVNWTWPFPRDKTTLVLGRDFLNLWMSGRAVLDIDPALFCDVAIYNGELARLLGPGYLAQSWPNPPTALVVMAPFGLLTYFPALIAWFTIGILAFYFAGRRRISDARILAVVLISPAALLCVISGQSSLLTTAALLAIFASLDKRPVLAGL